MKAGGLKAMAAVGAGWRRWAESLVGRPLRLRGESGFGRRFTLLAAAVAPHPTAIPALATRSEARAVVLQRRTR